MMRAMLKWAAAGLCLATLAWLTHRIRRILEVGAAYKAKVLCSALFGSRLDLDPATAPEVNAEAYWLMRPFRVAVDRERRRVTASLFGLRSRSAVWRPGLGATLEPAEGALFEAPAPPAAGAPSTAPWPEGDAPAPAPSPGLARALERAFEEPEPAMLRRTRAVVVVHEGKLVAERYAPGIGPDTPLPGWSMAKSALSALVGAAVRDGKLSLDRRTLLEEWPPEDPRSKLALEDLLRMRSGLKWSEDYSDPLSDVVQMLFARPAAGAFAALRPLEHPPGEAWKYSSGTTNLLSLVLRRALGEEAYGNWPWSALFAPLGMRTAVFERDGSGTFVGSSFLFAGARDWARFGQLYLQDGVWKGRRVLPEGWVRFSTTPTPLSEGRFGAHWWLKCPKELGGETEAGRGLPSDAFYAIGHEGQTLTVIPSRRLVVVRLGLSIRIDAWDQAAFLKDVLAGLP